MGFPALVIGIVLVGSVLTFFARDFRRGERSEAPTIGDHWHAAYAVDLCGAFEPNEATPDNGDGFHVHADGLIHIHPYVKSVAGKDATFGVFARNADIKLGDGQFTLPDGRTFKNGDDCTDEKGKKSKGRVALYVWPPQATDKTKPKIVTDDLAKERFSQEGMAFVLAFLPKGADMSLPPSTKNLKNPDDRDEPPADDSAPGGSDSSLPPEGTDTPGATETTQPGDTPGTTATSEPTEGSEPTGTSEPTESTTPETTAPTETTVKPGG